MNSNSPITKLISLIADMSTSRIAIIGLIFTAFYYTSLFNSGSNIDEAIKNLNAQIEQENIKKIETNRILKKEEQMRADVSVLVKKYEEVKSKIPIEFLESELRIIIDKFAEQNNLKTNKTNRGSAGQDLAAFQDANLVEQVPLEFSFTGTFAGVFSFIQQLSTTEKLIKLDRISMTASDQRQQFRLRSKDLTFNVTIIGFKQSSLAASENKKAGGQ